jgi:tryptophan 2-monooxygenase
MVARSFELPQHIMDSAVQGGPWDTVWPSPADLRFNYYKLLDGVKQGGIGVFSGDAKPSVAIIGGGLAGLMAARELVSCGARVTMFEATGRLNGRNYTIPNKASRAPENYQTPFEMGAMRMPFFAQPDATDVYGTQSILAYIARANSIRVEDFPNPGSRVANTGVYIHNGVIEQGTLPTLQIWEKTEELPPTDTLRNVKQKWGEWVERLTTVIVGKYSDKNPDVYNKFLSEFLKYYDGFNFRELVRLPRVAEWSAKEGLGGPAFSEDESKIFYTIGAGDGSWGAFYDICCLYPMRTFLFGFGSKLQLVNGRYNERHEFVGGGYSGDNMLTDSSGQPLQSPTYVGIRTFGDCLMFQPYRGDKALYAHSKDSEEKRLFSLYMNTIISEVKKQGEKVVLSTKDEKIQSETFDAVIATPPSWALQMNTKLKDFKLEDLSNDLVDDLNNAHWESACKVFVSLKEQFWTDVYEEGTIPQINCSDSFLRDMYAYKFSLGEKNAKEAGICLLSYTWEDDATKLGFYSDTELLQRCAAGADAMFSSCDNIKLPPEKKFSSYLDLSKATVVHWEKEPFIQGCAKLYRPKSLESTYRLLRYNQDHAKTSHMYLAGEGFSVDGGWTEPAYRMAIDAVIHMLNNFGGKFLAEDFHMGVYPGYFDPLDQKWDS